MELSKPTSIVKTSSQVINSNPPSCFNNSIGSLCRNNTSFTTNKTICISGTTMFFGPMTTSVATLWTGSQDNFNGTPPILPSQSIPLQPWSKSSSTTCSIGPMRSTQHESHILMLSRNTHGTTVHQPHGLTLKQLWIHPAHLPSPIGLNPNLSQTSTGLHKLHGTTPALGTPQALTPTLPTQQS